MKITFSNLGSIKKTTLDLRPLTVIIGPNNSNKTYIAYSIYGLWKKYSEIKDELDYPFGLEITEEASNRLRIPLNDDFYNKFIKFFIHYTSEFKLQLDTYFQDSTHKLFKRTKIDIEISKVQISEAVKEFVKNDLVTEIWGFNCQLTNNSLIIEMEESKIVSKMENSEDYDFQEDVLESIAFLIKYHLFQEPILLPAERNAFIITYKMLANRRYKHLRQTQREIFGSRSHERQLELLREQGDIRYPQPIEDFLDFLTDVELDKQISEKVEKRKTFNEFANAIEESIQRKNKTNFTSTKLGGREIKINVKKGLDIDLYNASSSIKQLVPLIMYLRYAVNYHSLLIIDEPEMNLHPEAQAKLLEVLAMIVNEGVNVLLTTHSPYFMSHLNNLVSGKTDDESVLKEQAKSLYLGDERAFLKIDDVSAYEMRLDKTGKHQELHNLYDPDYGIRWDTLSDVSADIQQKFFEIYEKGDTPTNGEKE